MKLSYSAWDSLCLHDEANDTTRCKLCLRAFALGRNERVPINPITSHLEQTHRLKKADLTGVLPLIAPFTEELGEALRAGDAASALRAHTRLVQHPMITQNLYLPEVGAETIADVIRDLVEQKAGEKRRASPSMQQSVLKRRRTAVPENEPLQGDGAGQPKDAKVPIKQEDAIKHNSMLLPKTERSEDHDDEVVYLGSRRNWAACVPGAGHHVEDQKPLVPDALAADKSEGDNDDDAVHLLTYPAREDSAAAAEVDASQHDEDSKPLAADVGAAAPHAPAAPVVVLPTSAPPSADGGQLDEDQQPLVPSVGEPAQARAPVPLAPVPEPPRRPAERPAESSFSLRFAAGPRMRTRELDLTLEVSGGVRDVLLDMSYTSRCTGTFVELDLTLRASRTPRTGPGSAISSRSGARSSAG